jgi:tetratricopeptide (TPR) repeat protein
MGFIANKEGDHAAAERFLEQALQADPNYDEAMLELASVKMAEKKLGEALPLLRQCTKLSPKPSQAYYKLATAERALHQTEAAERDLKIFETLAKEPAQGPYPFQHFVESFEQRRQLPAEDRIRLEIAELLRAHNRNPGQPSNLYLLAEDYLKLGQQEEAKKWVAELDKLSKGDVRTALGLGVLLVRYRMYPEAIQHFQTAVAADPGSDDAKFDLADSYFQLRDYQSALGILQQASPSAQQDDTTLALLADIYAHLGRTGEAIKIFGAAVQKNPENERYCLSLAMTHLRAGNSSAAEETLLKGLNRLPNSGELCWGMGILSALKGEAEIAEKFLRKSVDLAPEWLGGYSALGLLYFQTGQVAQAREVVDRFAKLFPDSGLNITHIQQALAAAQDSPEQEKQGLSPEARQQLLQLALALADRIP